MSNRNGIAVVGTLLVDHLYGISAYPSEGELAKIQSISHSLGGLVPNNGICLKKISPETKVFAVSKIGKDDSGAMAGIEPTEDNLPRIAKFLLDAGVRERVMIHQPSLGLCMTREKLTVLPSCKLPKRYVKGKTGAGDAFCSGALIGIDRGLSDPEILELAEAAAVASLTEQNATNGIMEIDKLLSNIRRLER